MFEGPAKECARGQGPGTRRSASRSGRNPKKDATSAACFRNDAGAARSGVGILLLTGHGAGEYLESLHGQEPHKRASDDVLPRERAPDAAVGALGAVVAHDKELLGVARIAEDDHVAALRRLKPVGELVDDEVLVVEERRLHRRARDDERLRDKKPDRKDYRGGNEHKLEELGEKIPTVLLRHASIVCGMI